MSTQTLDPTVAPATTQKMEPSYRLAAAGREAAEDQRLTLLEQIARVRTSSASADVRSGSGGAYCSRSRCALVASAMTYMRVCARARESDVYAHSRVNSDGRPITPAHSTVAPCDP